MNNTDSVPATLNLLNDTLMIVSAPSYLMAYGPTHFLKV